jgi:hypothetical protein
MKNSADVWKEKTSEDPCCHLVLLKPDIMEKTNEPEQILKTNDAEYIRILGRLHKSLETGMRSGNTDIAKKWLQERKLTSEITGACYNSGQIHHRKDQSFKEELARTGILKRKNVAPVKGRIPYIIFGRLSIIFPLRNKDQEVINFFAVGVEKNKTAFLNNDGIYPKYPGYYTEKLYILPSVLETATFLQAGVMKGNSAVMSLFDGKFKPQHYEAISALTQLKEITVIENKK